MTAESEKQNAGEAAAERVEAGMVVGLGSGTTAAYFLRALARRRLAVRCVPTSGATAALARALGLDLIDLDTAGTVDLTIDGADEIGPDLALIKGGGGALLREKLVWSASRRRLVIADAAKLVNTLGRFALPIEVVGFGHGTSAQRIGAALRGLGLPDVLSLRRRGDEPLVTDQGNLIYDAALGEIADPSKLADVLKSITGVVEHGLFIGLAHEALIGTGGEVRRFVR